MSDTPASIRILMLDPVDRVSEIVFGILMALSFTGTLSVAAAGREQVRTLLFAALGCNLAWGLADAVMYLVRAAIERRRKGSLLLRIQAARDPREAHQLITDALEPLFGEHVSVPALEALHARLASVAAPTPRLGGSDYAAAAGVFAPVVLATFPVVVPFIFISETAAALRLSNLLAVATLFVCGCALGRYAGERPWLHGMAMTAIGVALVAIVIALGG